MPNHKKDVSEDTSMKYQRRTMPMKHKSISNPVP